MRVLVIMLIVSVIVCGVGWTANYISAKAVIHYILEKGYELPSKEEIRKHTKYAAKHTLGLLDHEVK